MAKTIERVLAQQNTETLTTPREVVQPSPSSAVPETMAQRLRKIGHRAVEAVFGQSTPALETNPIETLAIQTLISQKQKMKLENKKPAHLMRAMVQQGISIGENVFTGLNDTNRKNVQAQIDQFRNTIGEKRLRINEERALRAFAYNLQEKLQIEDRTVVNTHSRWSKYLLLPIRF